MNLTRSVPRRIAAAILTVGMLAGGPGYAATVSYFIDQSNQNVLLPDGTNYLLVTITDSLLVPGDIDFAVEILAPLLTEEPPEPNNFGIQTFSFNVCCASNAKAVNVTNLPAGWSALDKKNHDGFGRFDIQLGDGGSLRQDPILTFTIAGIAGDTPSDYADLSKKSAGEGNMFFAAHVAGFNDVDPGPDTVGSAQFGGSTVVPVPAAAWLFASGLGCLGWLRRKSKPAI